MTKLTVRIKCFSQVRQETGNGEIPMSFPSAMNTEEFMKTFLDKYPNLKALPIRIAVNREYVNTTVNLQDGDEIALIPPVSGG